MVGDGVDGEVLPFLRCLLAGQQIFDDLNVLQIASSKVPIAFAGKGTIGARTSFGRPARALHATPDSLPLLPESDQTVLELAPTADGLAVIEPAAK